MLPNAYQQYKKQSINTMTPVDLLLKLYDEFVFQAKKALMLKDAGDSNASGQAFLKCRKIIGALNNSLDMQYNVSENLELLYEFFDRTIADAVFNGKTDDVEKIIGMVKELRETFAQAQKEHRIKTSPSALSQQSRGIKVTG